MKSSYNYFLFDYADVISYPQDMTQFNYMAKLLNMDEKKFHASYWKFRRDYDLGQIGEEYWPLVAERKLKHHEVGKLIATDCKSWGRINPVTIEYVNKLRYEGHKLGVLSNLPIDLVNFLRREYSFLTLFDDAFFSAEIHLVKPSPDIYQYVLQKIGMKSSEVIFFDDREENLLAARDIGINTQLVTQESINSLFVL
jgi:putative hydrolase of the HAD superfamily